jgi:endonuclease/exonuclease/phosphatase family metal-dependent hydrolase
MKLKAFFITALLLGGTAHGADRVILLRVLSYNIRNCTGLDEKRDIERTAAFIKAQQPDLVGLQEVDKDTRRSGRIDVARRLGELTGLHSVFGKAMDYQGGAYGDAVLSRYPFQKVVVHQLPATKGHEPREMMETQVAIGTNGPVVVFCSTHLDNLSAVERLPQVKAINALVAPQESLIQILAGDFNAGPDSSEIVEVLKSWNDAGPSSKILTCPANKPRERIDYIFFRPQPRLRILEANVLNEPLISDHRPVLVTVEIKVDNP